MQRIPLMDAQPEMILAVDLVNDQQMLLLKKGASLNAKNIKMLKSWGVAFIEIESDPTTDPQATVAAQAVNRAAVEERMAEKFGPFAADDVMSEIRRLATEIIMGRFHHQDTADAD